MQRQLTLVALALFLLGSPAFSQVENEGAEGGSHDDRDVEAHTPEENHGTGIWPPPLSFGDEFPPLRKPPGDTGYEVVPERDGEHERDDHRAIQDLEAQQTMASWTRNMGIVAVASLIMGGWGVWLLHCTLRATEAAVKETKRATDATELALQATQKTAQDQLRAYVTASGIVTKASIDGPNKPFSLAVSITLSNSGQTPAKDIMIRSQWLNSDPTTTKLPDIGAREARALSFRTQLVNGEISDKLSISFSFTDIFGGLNEVPPYIFSISRMDKQGDQISPQRRLLSGPPKNQ